MKKDISLELAVMPIFPLMVAVVVASIISGTKKCEFCNHNKKGTVLEQGLRAHQ
jgi:hypothetical protein